MMHFRLTALVLAMGLALGAPATAQTTDLAGIAAYFTDLADHPNELREVTEAIAGPMPDAVWDRYLPHAASVLRDPAYPAYVAARIAGLVGPNVTEEALLADFAAMGDAWAFGLRRLPQADQEAFLRFQVGSTAWIRDNAPEACALVTPPADPTNNGLIVATLSPEEREAIREATSRASPFYEQNLATADAYYALVAKATFAEIHGNPDVRPIPGDEVPLDTLFAYSIAMFDRLGALPGGAAAVAAMVAMANDPNATFGGLTPDVLCNLSIATYAAVDDLMPAERTIMVQAIIIGVGDPVAGARLLGGTPL